MLNASNGHAGLWALCLGRSILFPHALLDLHLTLVFRVYSLLVQKSIHQS